MDVIVSDQIETDVTTTLGKKTDTASVTASSSIFSWIKQIYTHLSTYLASARMAKIDTIATATTNSSKRNRTQYASSTASTTIDLEQTALSLTGSGSIRGIGYNTTSSSGTGANIALTLTLDGITYSGVLASTASNYIAGSVMLVNTTALNITVKESTAGVPVIAMNQLDINFKDTCVIKTKRTLGSMTIKLYILYDMEV